MTLTRKWTTIALFIFLMVNGVLWVNVRGLSSEGKSLRREVADIERQSAEIRSTFSMLRGRVAEVLDKSGREFAPAGDAEFWCVKQLSSLHVESELDITFSPRGLKLPFGIDASWNLQQAGGRVYLGMAPYQVKVALSGSLSSIMAFLRESERANRCVMVGRLELSSKEDGNGFEGTVILVYPQLLYAEDMIRFRKFTKE